MTSNPERDVFLLYYCVLHTIPNALLSTGNGNEHRNLVGHKSGKQLHVATIHLTTLPPINTRKIGAAESGEEHVTTVPTKYKLHYQTTTHWK